MNKPGLKAAAGLGGAMLALGLAFFAPLKALALQTLCAQVKLEILQQATLEREAFDAHLQIDNNLPDQPLTNLKVQIFVKDSAGQPVDANFFIKVTTITGTGAVDGSGVVQSSSTADIHWLIIPSSGTGGTLPAGQRYAVSATISGVSNGSPQSLSTFDAFITVHPQPVIKLEYALPYEVFSDEPLTTALVEPVEPFPLSVRVTNIGFGAANNFQIQSAQPQIVDNKLNLPVSFKLIGTQVGGKTIANTLLIPFGDLAPNAVSQASWIMTTTLSGRFVNFTSTFSHAADLGGQLTSLLQGVTTYTLLRDVLVDLAGRDQVPDFLVNENTDRSTMQDSLDAGIQPPAQFVLESDQPIPLPVTEVPGRLDGTLAGTNAALTYTFTQGVSSNVWVHSYVPFPAGGAVALAYTKRGDGKILNPANVWISKHFRKSDLQTVYWLNILDLTSSTNTYTLQFNPAGLDQPPGAVLDLAAVSHSSGAAALSWTAPGEDGYNGFLFGGRYLFEAETSSSTIFTPTAAELGFSTSTAPGVAQAAVFANLAGNSTYYFRMWTQDTGGSISALSNGATAYVFPNPPSGLLFTGVTSTSTNVSWQIGNNSLPIEYTIFSATEPGGVFVSSSPPQDSFTTNYSFGSLTPNTSYYYSGVGFNPETGAASPQTLLGVKPTLADPPVPGALAAVGTGTVDAHWAFGADPADTEFLVQLSTFSGQSPPAYESGWVHGSSFTFIGVAPQFLYSGRVKARNHALIETAYADLGSVALSFGISPVAAASGAPFTITGTDFGPYAGANTRVRFGGAGPLATVSNWSNSKITGTVPQLSTGTYDVLVERQSGAAVTDVPAGSFTAIIPETSTGPILGLTPFDEDEVTVSTPALVAVYADATAPLSTGTFQWSLDGVDITSVSVVADSSATYVPAAALSEGTHTVTASVADAATSTATASSTFLVDTVFPVTTLRVSGTAVSSAAVTVISTDSFSLDAFDSGSGVLDTVYLVDVQPDDCDFSYYLSTAPAGTCANPYYDGAFALSVGTHTLAFYSDDGAGNSEDYAFKDLTVLLPAVSTASADGVVELISRSSVTSVSSVDDSTAAAAALARGLTAATSFYDLSPSGVPFDPPAQLSFAFDPGSVSTTTLAIYTFNGVAWDSAAIAGQSLTRLSTGAVRLSGTLVHSSLYGVFSAPAGVAAATPTVSSIAPNAGGNDGAVAVTVDGSAFSAGAVLELQRVSPSPGFTATGGFPSFQTSGQAVRLPSGKVLYAGGDGSSSISAAAFLYDPAAGTWTPTGSMSAVRRAHRAVLLQNGKVLVVGGTSSGAGVVPLATAELYDPASGTWSATGSLNTAREFPMAVVLADGRVLVAGGIGSSDPSVPTAEVYDPASGAWSYTGSPSTPHDRAQGVLLANGKVLMAGGRNASGQFTADAELYDPAAGTWAATGPLSGPKQTFSMNLLPDGRVLVAGGDNGSYLSSAEVYDPAAGTWSATGAMTRVHVGAPSAVLPGGKVLVAGGSDGQGNAVQGADLYDPAAGTWSSPGTFPVDYLFNTATTLDNGLVLLAGGINSDGAGAYLYGPASFDIFASSVSVLNPTQLSGVFDLSGLGAGAWNVVVANPGGGTGELTGGFTIHDTVPPAAVVDLGFAAVDASSVTLAWTAPASPSGALASYDLRHATFPITAANFASATPAGAPSPGVAGSSQSVSVAISSDTAFFAALKSSDAYGNVSSLSNVASLARATVTVDGEPEMTFYAGQPVSATLFSTAPAPGGVLAAATSQQLTLAGSLYDLGPEGTVFTPAASLSFRYSPTALSALGLAPGDIKIYQFVPGGGLVAVSSQTLNAAAQTITAPIATLSSVFGLFGPEAAPIVTAISPNTGAPTGVIAVSVTGSNLKSGASFLLRQLASGATGFTATGGFPSFQTSGRAVRLPNGKVLYAGGDGSSSISAAAFLYDPAAGTWTPTGSMSAVRRAHRAVLLQSGKVLVVGGTSSGAGVVPLAAAELYDPASGTWSATGSLNTAREFPMTVVLADGRVLVAGGIGSSDPSVPTAEIYDPASGVWSYTGSPSTPHDRAQGVLLANGKVLLAGGRNASGQFTADAELYDPAAGTWAATGPLSGPKQTFSMNLLADGRVLVAGGDNGSYLSSAEVYDPAAGTWSATGAMTRIHVDGPSAVLPGGKVLVAGGSDGQGNAVQGADLYDPAAGTWSSPGAFPVDYLFNTATTLDNGLVLLAGGINSDGAGAYLYGPASFDIAAASVAVAGPTQMTGALDLTGQPLGSYSVIATNPSGLSGTLAGGFSIATTVPPDAVADLAFSILGSSSATVRWSAPTAHSAALTSYDLRRSSTPITGANFGSATAVTAPSPATVGTIQTADLAGLPDPSLFVALKSQDALGNISAISNVASLVRSTVIVAGAPELSFVAERPVTEASVSTISTTGSVVLASATAQGLVLVSSIYDLGPEGETFTPPATLTIRYSTETLAALGLSTTDVRLYEFFPSSGLVAVSGQALDPQTQSVTAPISTLSSIFALFGSPMAPSLASIEISPSSATVEAGTTGQFRAKGTYTDGSTQTIVAQWSSDAPEIATITSSGFATALTTGTAVITASSGTVVSSTTLTVIPPSVRLASIGINPSSATVAAGTTGQFSAVGTFTDGSTQTIVAQWSSNAPEIATITPSGFATALTTGTAVITASSGTVVSSTTLTIVSAPALLASIEISPSSATVEAGTGGQFTAVGTFTDGSTQTIAAQWSSNAPEVATITPSGFVTAVATGTAMITASSDTVTDSTILTVVPASTSTTMLLVDSISPSDASTGESPAIAVTGRGFDSGAAIALERWDITGGSWSATGSMSTPFEPQALIVLHDGRALSLGGFTGSSATAHAEIFDPHTDTWTAAAAMSTPRGSDSYTLLPDGRVLAAGGYDQNITALASAELYDPVSGAWSSAPMMSTARREHTATLLPDGKILVAGGHSGTVAGGLASSEIYDPTSNTWSPAASMSTKRVYHAAILLRDGRVLVAGGFDFFDQTHANRLTSCEIYDPVTNAWTTTGSMNVARGSGSPLALLGDGRVIAVGGEDNPQHSQSAEVYDPATGAWTLTGSLGAQIYEPALIERGGTVLAIGGLTSPGQDTLTTTKFYDVATNSWEEGPMMGTARLTRAATLRDGRILVAGGLHLNPTNDLSSAEFLTSPVTTLTATGVADVDAQHLTGTFDLTGAATGYWDAVVTESGSREGRLSDAFLVHAPATGLSVRPSTLTVTVSHSAPFTAIAAFADGTSAPVAASWSGDAPSIADVTAGGLVRTLAIGTAHVTASYRTFSAQGTLYVAPPAVTDLMTANIAYGQIGLTWTSAADQWNGSLPLAYDLRVSTSLITSADFDAAMRVPNVAAPLPAGTPSSFTVTGLAPGLVYYFAVKTTNDQGLTSAISNVASVYSGDFAVTLDASGRKWELDGRQYFSLLGRAERSGYGFAKTLYLPWQPRSSAVGTDGDDDGYAVFTPTAPVNGTRQNVTVYELSPDGVFIDSRAYTYTNGQIAALNQVPFLEHALAADSDGDALWIAGSGSGSAGLWKADPAALTLVGLTAGATAQTVLANGNGAVWMAGRNDGEMVLWRYDVPSGQMRRYGWTNTLGGTGSAGQAIVEEVSGDAWVAGWANTASGRVAALWQWDGSSVSLVATSTGVYSDQAVGLDLDDAGRFWLSGPSQTASDGTLSLALWQYPASGGGSLLLADSFADYPQSPAFAVGHGLALADGKAWALNGPDPYGVHGHDLGLGDLAGTVTYPAGFNGGNVGFFTSNTSDFNNDVTFYGLIPAPASGSAFGFTLTGLPAPATYYVAAVYDLSGSVMNSGQPGAGDPIGASLTPTPLAANAAAPLPAINLNIDQQPPALAILAPLDASTVPASAFAISGTAADDTGISDLRFGLQNLADGTWWDEQSSTFVASIDPRVDMSLIRSGPLNNLTWSADAQPLRPFLTPGGAYKVFIQATDISGHAAAASASLVIMSTTNPVVPGYAMAFRRDDAGNLWTVTQDFLIQGTGQNIPLGVTLRKYDSAGTFLSTTSLPGASDNGGFYGIAFDHSSGDAWVGGSSDNGGDAALTLWKVSASNDVLFGSATIVAPGGGSIYGGGIAVDGSGNAWVSGAEQTSAGAFTFRFGLWKFDPFGNLAQTAYSQRPGGDFDGGLATAIGPDGALWSAGISSNPASGLLDLALWKYDAGGNLVSVSFSSGAFISVDNAGVGLAPDPAGGVWVSASQAYPKWNASDLSLLHFDASGVLISSALWHGDGSFPVQGHSVALDPAGNPWVAGLTGPDAASIWKYSAAGALAQGYPKRDSPDFDDAGIVVDPSGTVWASYAGEPFVFTGTTTVPGAPGAGPLSFAGYSNLSGTLSYPAGFVAGSTVTIVVSSTNFNGDQPQAFAFAAPSGVSLPYTLSLVAPASYSIAAFVGSNHNHLTPDEPLGFYDHFAAVPLSTSAPTSGIDFTLALDSVPPTSIFNGVVDGSTLAALASIQGTAYDNLALGGDVNLAATDLDTGLWWNAHKQDWVASTAPYYHTIASIADSGSLDSRAWRVNAAANQLPDDSGSFGGFSDFLPLGHHFRLLTQAIDLVGNTQSSPTAVTFTWLGADGAFGPPNAVNNLAVTDTFVSSAAFFWTAPGEHQNAGTALAFDLRIATFPISESNFASADSIAPLPAPFFAGSGSTATVTALTAGVHYVGLKTVNHEGGTSALSNVVWFSVPGEPLYTAVSADGLATLVSVRPDETVTAVSTTSVAAAYQVAVSSQGLQSIGSLYNLQPSPVSFSPPASFSIVFDTVGVDLSRIAIYTFDGVLWDSSSITSQQLTSVSSTSARLSGTLAHASLYALFLSPARKAPALASLAVVPSSASLTVGATLPFAALGTFTDGSTQTVAASWSSDAPSIATVTAQGLATGLTAGTAQITASSGAVTGSATLTVTGSAALTSITVSPSSASVALGGAQAFTATGHFGDGSTRALSGGGSWQDGAAMLQSRLGPAGAYWNGKFYAVSGQSPTAEEYDVASGSWTAIPPPPLNRAYSRAAAAAGRIYVAGGCVAADCGSITAEMWAYDPSSGTWTQEASLPAARYDPVFVELGGKLYLAGGINPGYSASNRLDVYDPGTNAWTRKADMPLSRGQSGGGVVGGRLYVAGGNGGGSVNAETMAYDPATDSWTLRSPMPRPSLVPASAALDGRLYLVSGATAPALTGVTETLVYDPGADRWSAGPSVNLARYDGAAAAGDGSIFLAGGGTGNVATTSFETLAPGSGVTWSSDAPSVATVTAAGTATGLTAGTAHVSASSGAVSGSATLTVVSPDATPPVTTIAFSSPSFASSGVLTAVATRSSVTLSAVDPSSGSIAASGVAATFYSVDAPTQPATAYTGAFQLPTGTHTVYYYSSDAAGNVEAVSSATVAVYDGPFAGTISPSTGPIGITLSLRGFGFGAYGGSVDSQLRVGAGTAPVSVWNDGLITATVPGLSTGAYALSVVTLQNGATAAVEVGTFTILAPAIATVVPSTGPIGLAFTLTGTAFGSYASANTQVLIGGATAPISVWNDTTITGTVPGSLTPGSYPLQVRRTTADGGEVLSNAVAYDVLGLNVAAVTPSTGPIGITYSLTGSGFGTYASANTVVLIGGTTTSISVWNDTNIVGVIPALSTGAYPLVVERMQGADSSYSNVATFTVTALEFAGPTPSSGPIGIVFGLSGTGFGAYASANTRLLMGGATVAVSVWNDTTITGTVPALPPGPQPVWIERLSGGGVQSSATSYFDVVAPEVASITPSTGPIGIAYAIHGSGFGTYSSLNTRVLIGGTTTSVSLWNDTTILGTIPALSTGDYPVTVVRLLGADEASSNVATFTVTALSLGAPTPSSGPTGVAFTLNGTGFGAYASANTRLLLGGTTVAVSVWNDTTITGTVPTLPPGPQPLWIERLTGGGLQSSDTVYFDVLAPAIASVTPSSGPIGIAFTLTGDGFGTYSSVNTHVLLGGTSCPISVWNDTTITGTVPGGLAPGSVTVVVERIGTGGVSYSTAAAFLIEAPSVASVAPASAPIGSLYTLTGSGFGTYATGSTSVLIGGTTTAISLWSDSTIKGTVPALATGTYTLQVERQQGGYSSLSESSSFTVVGPEVADMTPSSAPIGAPFTITGSGFGAYSSVNTYVRFNGVAAPVSVWNDTTIKGTVPGAAAAGPATVVVERLSGSFAATGDAPSFLVLTPTISTITPSYGPAGTAVTLNGFGFGPYAGASGTQLLVGGSTMTVAVWNDSTIRWTVPASLTDGTYPVVVSRTPAGGAVQSSSAAFTVGTGIGVGALFTASAAPLASRPDWHFEGDLNLPAAEGGRILTPSQAAVEVPPGALEQDTEVTLARGRDLFTADRAAALGRDALDAAGEAISFGPEGTQFTRPVVIELPYDPALVPAGRLGELAVNYYDPDAKTWTPLVSQVDTARHVVSAQTSHFSLYQPLVPAAAVASAAQDAFGLRAAYVFPNPARGVSAVTFRVQPGLADSVEVRVYDLSGRRVHSSADFRFSLTDDGNGLGAQDTYDGVWDVSGVASGVYTYVITARKAGQSDIHKTGRIGVIK